MKKASPLSLAGMRILLKDAPGILPHPLQFARIKASIAINSLQEKLLGLADCADTTVNNAAPNIPDYIALSGEIKVM